MTTLQRPWDQATSIWATETGLSVFTGLLALEVFVVAPLASLGVLGTGPIDVVFTLFLVCGALALHTGQLLRLLAGSVVGIAIGLRWMAAWHPSAWIMATGSLLVVVTLACFAAIVLQRVFEPGPVTRHRIHGAVCAYLLCGLMWAAAYTCIEQVFPQAFSLPSGAGPGDNLRNRFVYFSFVTLTTVGYGDIVAVHPLARTFVVAEALTGQLFPAIIIGGLVSSVLQARLKS